MAADRKLTIDWLEAGELEHGVADDVHAEAWKGCAPQTASSYQAGSGTVVSKEDPRRQLRTDQRRALLRHLPRTASGGHRICAQRARHGGSTSTEFDEDCPNPAVIFAARDFHDPFGWHHAAWQPPNLFQVDDCKVKRLYGGSSVDERHRHRYEVNPELIERLEAAGLTFVGKDETGQRCEIRNCLTILTLWRCSTTPNSVTAGRPSPPFLGLILAASGNLCPERSRTLDADACA